jgi:sialidase-1
METFYRITFLFLFSFINSLSCFSQEKILLFDTPDDGVPYRIPTIIRNNDGSLLAIADYRRGGDDIGFGPIDIHGRMSFDDGKTWGEEFTMIKGGNAGDGYSCAHGDAAVVCDRKSGELMLLAASGEIRYGHSTRENPQSTGLFFSSDGGRTWSGKEVTEQFYKLFDESSLGPIKGLFVGSGKLTQSRKIKAGSHYRVYAPVCARDNGNRVLYTDDFGKTWHALGDVNKSPAPLGDEPKIEELPNGNVLLSSRMYGGRYFNIYTYKNKKKATGSWAEAAPSDVKNNGVASIENSCNGEIYILKVRRVSDGKKVWLALQSVPFGKGRANVGIYYKSLTNADMELPEAFASDWEGKYQVSNEESAYSTMVTLNDGAIGFYWEEHMNAKRTAYDLYFQRLTIEQITNGKYK